MPTISFKIFFYFALSQVISVELKQKPDKLWQVFENTSPQFIRYYADENAKSPNIDKLVK